jgi:nitronate monooxygenase
MDFGSGGSSATKVWKDIWGCGQGIGAVRDIPSATDLIARLAAEFEQARTELDARLRP